MENQAKNIKKVDHHETARKIDAGGWGLFFVWIGIAFLIDIGYGVGLFGIGVITLGAQAVRKIYHLRLEGFWILVGGCFILGGLWEFIDPEIGLVPILLIVAGLALLYSVWRKK